MSGGGTERAEGASAGLAKIRGSEEGSRVLAIGVGMHRLMRLGRMGIN